MPTDTYITADGSTLTLNLTDEESVWLATFRVRAADPNVSVGTLTNEAYADTNPILAPSPIPGRGWVTREVHARPAYRAILDLIYQKTVQETGSDAGERFTVTVSDAAAELGISDSAVRQAMRDGRLPSMKKGRRLMTSLEAVAGYQVSNRGPQSEERVRRSERGAPVRARWGSETVDGVKVVLHIDHDGTVVERDGERFIQDWTRIVVRSTVKKNNTHRYWEITPAEEAAEITLEGFGVWGPFRVVRAERGRNALEAWKSRPR